MLERCSRRIAAALALPLLLAACEEGRAAPGARVQSQHVASSAASSSIRGGRLVTFRGACDASGAVPLDARRFAVADDEDNLLRVYDGEVGGAPLQTADLSPRLELRKKKHPESDIEAATRIGEEIYFLTSHGRTRKGKADPDRALFFATRLPGSTPGPLLIGEPYRGLLEDLGADARFQQFALADAARRAPKQPGGLNLEGMTAGPDGTLLIGFRSPVPRGRALLFRLLNPKEVVRGSPARLSGPLLLDLGGLGVRAITRRGDDYLIAAGPAGEGGPFQLFRFDGRGAPRRVPGVHLGDLTVEGFFSVPERDEILVLSDDGGRLVEGERCKDLDGEAEKRFRGLWLPLAP